MGWCWAFWVGAAFSVVVAGVISAALQLVSNLCMHAYMMMRPPAFLVSVVLSFSVVEDVTGVQRTNP